MTTVSKIRNFWPSDSKPEEVLFWGENPFRGMSIFKYIDLTIILCKLYLRKIFQKSKVYVSKQTFRFILTLQNSTSLFSGNCTDSSVATWFNHKPTMVVEINTYVCSSQLISFTFQFGIFLFKSLECLSLVKAEDMLLLFLRQVTFFTANNGMGSISNKNLKKN